MCRGLLFSGQTFSVFERQMRHNESRAGIKSICGQSELMRAKSFVLLAAVLFLAVGCEEQHRPNTTPVAQAIAPTITTPAPQVPAKVDPQPQALTPDPVDVTIAEA